MTEGETMKALERVLKQDENVVARRVADEDLLVPIRGRLADMQRIFALDPVASHIWSRLDGRTPLRAITASVVAEFEVDTEQAGHDVMAFVAALEAAGLVTEVRKDPGA